MIVWGGQDASARRRDGAPARNIWNPVTTVDAPSARLWHTAVWTGSEMIIWGGYNGGSPADGGRYNPTDNTWSSVTSTGAPPGRNSHTAVWTGSEMIIWGGNNAVTQVIDGGRYNPATNKSGHEYMGGSEQDRRPFREKFSHCRVNWRRNDRLGGFNGAESLNDGRRYSPTTDTWSVVNTTGAPAARYYHTAVWTGSEMIAWGGTGGSPLNGGGR